MNDFLLFALPAGCFLVGLAFLRLGGKNMKWVRRAAIGRLLHEVIRAQGSVVRVEPVYEWYFAVWQKYLALAALACFVVLAMLAPAWFMLTDGSVALGLVAGLACLKVGWDVREQILHAS